MTPDQAAELLSVYELTGGRVNETARRLGLAKSTVSEHVKAAGLVPEDSRPSPRKIDWAKAWGKRESKTLEIIDRKADDASFRDLSIFAGIAADKRYREEHPESVKGTTVNVDARQVSIVYEDRRELGEPQK